MRSAAGLSTNPSTQASTRPASKQLMDDARPGTTAIYDRHPAAAKARAASLIHVPYIAREHDDHVH